MINKYKQGLGEELHEKKVIKPIKITSDEELDEVAKRLGFIGSGVKGDPYLMLNYEINANGWPYCIYIENTTRYFVIGKCKLYNAHGGVDSGIFINDAENIYIVQNEITNCGYGINALNTWYSEIIYNRVEEASFVGISLYNCVHNKIYSNRVIRSGSFGISLFASADNHVELNECIGNDVGIFVTAESEANEIEENDILKSLDDGLSICYTTKFNEIHDNKYKENAEANAIYFRAKTKRKIGAREYAILPPEKYKKTLEITAEKGETD